MAVVKSWLLGICLPLVLGSLRELPTEALGVCLLGRFSATHTMAGTQERLQVWEALLV